MISLGVKEALVSLHDHLALAQYGLLTHIFLCFIVVDETAHDIWDLQLDEDAHLPRSFIDAKEPIICMAVFAEDGVSGSW